MTIHLFAPRNRATSITTIAVLGLMALLVAPSTPAHAATSGRPTPMLAQGAGMGVHPSVQVRVVQRALHHRGYDLGPPGVDGRFGPVTAAAVRQMQADYGLAVDGIVGSHTRRALGLAATTQRRSSAAHRTKTTNERTPTGQAAPRRASAHVTTARTAPTELSHQSASLLDSLLAGALGGLIVLLLVKTISARRRQRDPDEDRPQQTLRLDHNHNGAAPISAHGASGEARPPALTAGHRVIGYVTVPQEPRLRHDEKSSQAIKAMCERSGWELLEIVRDREVGPTLERPGLGYALERIAGRQADALVVSELKRLSRSVVDLGVLMGWFRDAGAALIALDLGIDTSTPRGHHVATTLITLSDHAHERLAHRAGNAVTDVRAARRPGRPAVRDDPELLRRIASMRSANMTLQAIADELNAKGVPTLRGGSRWRPSSIQAALGYRRPGPRGHLPSLDERSVRT